MKTKITTTGLIALFIITVFTFSSCDKKPIKLTGHLTNLEEIKAYLHSYNKSENGNSPDNALPLPVALEGGLGKMTEIDSSWQQLLSLINDAEKYVKLDLSLCEMEPDGRFDPVNRFDFGKKWIESLVLPDTAVKIADSTSDSPVFSYFSDLCQVSGKNITYIGSKAFKQLNKLKTADFLKAEYIESEAFYNANALKTINIPNVKSIGKHTFFNSGIDNISFNELTTISDYAFTQCEKLKDINLPKAQYIGEGAFLSCAALISVNLPQAINIENYAFINCSGLKEINLRADAAIGEKPFLNCISLVSFNLSGEGNLSAIEDGKALIKKYNNEIVLFAYPSAEGEIKISNVTKIAPSVFEDCKELKSAYFPDVSEIGENIFTGCENLETINFPSLIKINRSAFEGLTKLYSANFPSALTIEENAFKNCVNLSKINLPSVQFLESEAFASDFNSASNSSIDIYFGNTAPNFGTNVFFGAKITITVLVPKGSTGYGKVPATYEGDDNDQNWGNGLRGKGWDGHTGGYNIGAVNSNITVNVKFI